MPDPIEKNAAKNTPPGVETEKQQGPDHSSIVEAATNSLSAFRKSVVEKLGPAAIQNALTDATKAMEKTKDVALQKEAEVVKKLEEELDLLPKTIEELPNALGDLPENLKKTTVETANKLGTFGNAIKEKLKGAYNTTVDSISDGIQYIFKQFEYWQNQFAYMLAPLIEMLSKMKLPFFGEIQSSAGGIMEYLGMHQMMLYGSFRKYHIDPVFNSENPSIDSDAIKEMKSMAETIKKEYPGFSERGFFDDAALQYKTNFLKGRKTFKLAELVSYTRTSVFDKALETAKKEAEKMKVPVTFALKDRKIEAMRNSDKLVIERKTDGSGILIDGKEWKLSAMLGPVPIPVQIMLLEIRNGALFIKGKAANQQDKDAQEGPLDAPTTSELFEKMKNNSSHDFKVGNQPVRISPV